MPDLSDLKLNRPPEDIAREQLRAMRLPDTDVEVAAFLLGATWYAGRAEVLIEAIAEVAGS
jgi:hypothetical protein